MMSSNTTPFLSIRQVAKNFGAFKALRDINLDIHRGEFVCFLGPSGCGKTTLLRAVAGLDLQDSGTIHMGGRDVSHGREPLKPMRYAIVKIYTWI